jgi:hypothetical protein
MNLGIGLCKVTSQARAPFMGGDDAGHHCLLADWHAHAL